jgi:phage shock protein A
MGIFSRVRDIINSNINAMLDKAEDPEKLVKLIIHEMEDALVETKASCAGAMAEQKKMARQLEEIEKRADNWGQKAEMAVEKGREDLAREALVEKRRYRDRAEAVAKEIANCDAIVEQYKSEIVQLEQKLATARERQRTLVQRHIHAQQKKRTEQGIRKADTSQAMQRFEHFENRIERMEAEADLVNYGRKTSLEDEFAQLEGDEEIEKELADLKAAKGGKKGAESSESA